MTTQRGDTDAVTKHYELDMQAAADLGWTDISHRMGTPPGENGPHDVPFFSTDVRAAIAILESFPAGYSIARYEPGSVLARQCGLYRVEIKGRTLAEGPTLVAGDTLPIAVCMALRSLKEAEVPLWAAPTLTPPDPSGSTDVALLAQRVVANEDRLFAIAIWAHRAWRGDDVQTTGVAGSVLAATPEEARADGLAAIYEQCPMADGWRGHHCRVTEVTAYQITEAAKAVAPPREAESPTTEEKAAL